MSDDHALFFVVGKQSGAVRFQALSEQEARSLARGANRREEQDAPHRVYRGTLLPDEDATGCVVCGKENCDVCLHKQAAPVSATEPDVVMTCERCGIADADVRFDGDFTQHPTDGGCFFALCGERNTLRARVAALETVTEEQVERARKVVFANSANRRFAGQPYSVDEIVRDALTAARGGG